MRKNTLLGLILAALIPISSYSSEWVYVGSVDQPGIQPSISVASINVAWIVGGSTQAPKIFKSIDRGVNWSTIPTTGIGQELYCVAGFTDQIAYVGEGVVNGGANLFRTTNGGLNWTSILITPPNRGWFNGLAFTKANGNLFGLAIAERIYRSTNAGQSWIELNPAVNGVSNATNSLFIIDNFFYGFGLNNGSARVRLTADNSSTWSTQQVNVVGSYTSAIAFSSTKMIGLAATSTSMPYIARTSDGGLTWTSIDIGPGVTGNCFLNWIAEGPVVYIMGANGGVKRSTDNGLTWVTTPTPVSNLKHFDFVQYNNIVIGYAVSSDGSVIRLDDTLGVLTGINSNNHIPHEFSLEQNYPNPFNPASQIEYNIAKETFVRLSVYDALGREVNVLVNENKKPGTYNVTFDGTNLNTGVYFYKLEAGGFTQTRKMILLK
ncbi:MAG TPA: T9SS type A sorting domain-containing protein [Ignavibacteria bacterium]|jgi:photosystem II stability/assembly factor-like uncharacterized protein